jgi:hypothetical protein
MHSAHYLIVPLLFKCCKKIIKCIENKNKLTNQPTNPFKTMIKMNALLAKCLANSLNICLFTLLLLGIINNDQQIKKSLFPRLLNHLLKFKQSILAFFAITLFSFNVSAHGVQAGYCQLQNGFIRVYIEHWHGPGQNVDCGAGGTINVSVALNGETPIYLPLKKKVLPP